MSKQAPLIFITLFVIICIFCWTYTSNQLDQLKKEKLLLEIENLKLDIKIKTLKP